MQIGPQVKLILWFNQEPLVGYLWPRRFHGWSENLSLVNYQLSFLVWIDLGAVRELNETGIWLLTILKDRMAPESLVTSHVKKNRELARMLSASIRTAQAKGSQRTDDK